MTARLWTIVAVVGVVAVGAGVGIGAGVWAGGDHGAGGMPAMATHGASPAMGGRGAEAAMPMNERRFMEMIVPHHESAVQMARLALTRARHAEVRRLARQIIATQRAEIARMRSWHREWFGTELRPATTGSGAMADMADLEAAGADFDRLFLARMIAHHASAVMMADAMRMAEPRGQTDRLAREIVAAQAKEIGQMQQWRERWYPAFG